MTRRSMDFIRRTILQNPLLVPYTAVVVTIILALAIIDAISGGLL